VKNTDEITMEDIATGKYMPLSNLSIISQKLYNCISGKKFVLDDSNFPDFSKAIEIDPRNSVYLHNRGCCYRNLGDLKKSV
jgi:hypothetical protein